MVRILVRWIMTSATVELLQVEQAAEHVALGLLDRAFPCRRSTVPRSSSVAERSAVLADVEAEEPQHRRTSSSMAMRRPAPSTSTTRRTGRRPRRAKRSG